MNTAVMIRVWGAGCNYRFRAATQTRRRYFIRGGGSTPRSRACTKYGTCCFMLGRRIARARVRWNRALAPLPAGARHAGVDRTRSRRGGPSPVEGAVW